jgi:formate dehydrogenase subunit gamma
MITQSHWNEATAKEIIEARRTEAGSLLPILHDLQHAFGYVDDSAIPVIATTLNISRAEVHGVITYYHDFRHAPAGRTVLKVCRAESCQSMGCGELVDHLERAHGLELGQTSADGSITVEEVFCLGNCALSPAVLVNDELLGCVTTEDLDDVIKQAAVLA